VRILIEAHHPSDIHFFKYAVREWTERGNDVLLLGRDRDVMRALLSAYDFIPHRILSSERRDNRLPFAEMLERQVGVARGMRSFRPDVVMSLMGSYAQSAFLFRVPNLVFTDSEHQSFNHRIAHPFATRIYTPECFEKDLGRKQRRYRGYHELAFLHPKRFSPDPQVLSEVGVEARRYVVLRTSAWNTLHDIGKSGLGGGLEESVAELSKRAPVLLVPEGGQLPPALESLRLRTPPDRYHDVLAFARLVVSEGASTASEAACLGVPTVYLNPNQLGYLRDQERRYGLVYNTTDPAAAMRRALTLLDAPFDPKKQEDARKRLVDDHVDVTDYLIDQVADLRAAKR
jgi:predicted glycosyltransferase